MLLYPDLESCAKVNCSKECEQENIKMKLAQKVEKLRSILMLYETQKVICLLQTERAHKQRLEKYRAELGLDWKVVFDLATQLNGTNDKYWNALKNIRNSADTDVTMDITDHKINLLNEFIADIKSSNQESSSSKEHMEDFINALYTNIAKHSNKHSLLLHHNNISSRSKSSKHDWTHLKEILLKYKQDLVFRSRLNASNEMDVMLANLLSFISNTTNTLQPNEKQILGQVLVTLMQNIEKLIRTKSDLISKHVQQHQKQQQQEQREQHKEHGSNSNEHTIHLANLQNDNINNDNKARADVTRINRNRKEETNKLSTIYSRL